MNESNLSKLIAIAIVGSVAKCLFGPPPRPRPITVNKYEGTGSATPIRR